MRRLIPLSTLLLLIVGSACTSYEEELRIETALTQSVNRFHEQLNDEQFQNIYLQADASLRERIDEAAFTNQLKSAHDQLGKVAAEKRVLLTTRAFKDLQWAKFFGRKQVATHAEMPSSELVIASERFAWTLEKNEPRLASYEFRFICRKPC